MTESYKNIEINIGETIKQGLKKNNLTQKDFAKVMDKSISLVSEWTRNVKTPSGKDLIKIALCLDVVELLFPGYVKDINYTHRIAESAAEYDVKEELNCRVSILEKKVKRLEKTFSKNAT